MSTYDAEERYKSALAFRSNFLQFSGPFRQPFVPGEMKVTLEPAAPASSSPGTASFHNIWVRWSYQLRCLLDLYTWVLHIPNIYWLPGYLCCILIWTRLQRLSVVMQLQFDWRTSYYWFTLKLHLHISFSILYKSIWWIGAQRIDLYIVLYMLYKR